MKEILKHYKPPLRQDFANGAAIVVDHNNHLVCFCENETIAQEIAAALNNAVTWNVESTPTGENWFEDAWKAAEVEGG